MREALTIVSRRQCVLSMMYPKNLGGGHGPDRLPLTLAEYYRRSMRTPVQSSAKPTDAALGPSYPVSKGGHQ
jgi:hypothetical protein